MVLVSPATSVSAQGRRDRVQYVHLFSSPPISALQLGLPPLSQARSWRPCGTGQLPAKEAVLSTHHCTVRIAAHVSRVSMVRAAHRCPPHLHPPLLLPSLFLLSAFATASALVVDRCPPRDECDTMEDGA